MEFTGHPDGLKDYAATIKNVIAAGDKVVDWLPRGPEYRSHALEELIRAVDVLQAQTEGLAQGPLAAEALFSNAAMEAQAGYLLIEARRSLENGDGAGIQMALDNLRAEEIESAGGLAKVLEFDDDLLRAPDIGASDESALADFKVRASRTLDNMVTEADEVLASTIDRFKDTFEQFYEALGKLFDSFSADAKGGTIASGIHKVVGSLNKMTELLHNEGLQQIIASLKEMVHSLNLKFLVGRAFGCDSTKKVIGEVKLGGRIDRKSLHTAGSRMAEISRQYVVLLQRIRRVLNVVGLVGGALLLTGVAAHYVGPALPVAYALIALITVLIGVNFASVRVRGLITNL